MPNKLREALVFGEGFALLTGTIVGAGFLVLPYTALKAGIGPAIFWFLVLVPLVTLLHLMYAEIVAAADDDHRLPGYAAKMLGPLGKHLSRLTFLVGIFGGLVIYLILGGQFLKLIAGNWVSLSDTAAVIIFWLIFSFLIVANLKLSSRINLAITLGTTAILIGLSVLAGLQGNLVNFSVKPVESFFFPYGIVMFALIGYVAVPEIYDLLRSENQPRRLLKPIVISGTVFVGILMTLFMISILGATGPATSATAISGLTGKLNFDEILVGFILAFLELATSYLIFGISVRRTLERDFKLSPALAAFAAVVVPITLVLAGISNFLLLIGLLGTVLGSIDAILITLIYSRLGGERSVINLPRWFLAAMTAAFAVGGVASVVFAL